MFLANFFLQIDILGFEFLLQGLDLPKRILQSASARWRFNSAAALAAKTLTRSIGADHDPSACRQESRYGP